MSRTSRLPSVAQVEQAFELAMGICVGLASPLAAAVALLVLGSVELDVRQVGERLVTWAGPSGSSGSAPAFHGVVLLEPVAPVSDRSRTGEEPMPPAVEEQVAPSVADGAEAVHPGESAAALHGGGMPDAPGAWDSVLAVASRADDGHADGVPWGDVAHGIPTAGAGGGLAGVAAATSSTENAGAAAPGPARPVPPGHAVLDAAARMRFVAVAEGGFWMGSPEDEPGRFANEGPRHRVSLGAFWMAATEVTRAQWRAVMGASPAMGSRGGRLPVVGVSWCDAVRYANALSEREGLQPAYRLRGRCGFGGTVHWVRDADGYRLPTEAEWEFAARAGQDGIYAGGSELDAVGWHADNAGERPRDVASLAPNALGLHDMSGNVWEWVWDWLGDYPADHAEDPAGPERGQARILRGGAWRYDARFHRVADRNWGRPGYRSPAIGFRLARTLRPGDQDALVAEE